MLKWLGLAGGKHKKGGGNESRTPTHHKVMFMHAHRPIKMHNDIHYIRGKRVPRFVIVCYNVLLCTCI